MVRDCHLVRIALGREFRNGFVPGGKQGFTLLSSYSSKLSLVCGATHPSRALGLWAWAGLGWASISMPWLLPHQVYQNGTQQNGIGIHNKWTC